MNRRISLMEVTERLQAQLSPSLAIARVGCALETDFLSAVADPANWPGVWVGGQKANPISTIRRTGLIRQTSSVVFVVRVIVAKHVDGETNQELQLNAIADAVADELIGWKPTGAELSVEWGESIDGPSEQSVATVDMVFKTQTMYQKQTNS